jgi:flagellar hook-associated protein 1 FlgK
MSSLFASLGIARQALQAQQIGLDVTQNNIANVNTEGYARQRLNLIPGDSVFDNMYQVGMGVRLGSIDSYRSKFLDKRVNDELQSQGEFDASSAALQQVEAIFNEGQGTGLQSALSAFFNSFSTLAATPEDISLRQQLLASGEDLCAQVRHAYEQLQSIQYQQNATIAESVAEINEIAASIARLNVEVEAAQGANTNETTLRDQRQTLLDKLAKLTDLSYFESDLGGITVISRQGTLIVMGDRSNPWSASVSGTTSSVFAEGGDITASITSGALGGLLGVQEVIGGYLTSLDDMAAAVITRVNQQHALGSDLDGVSGGDFFTPFTSPVPGSNQGAARALEVAITDPRLIAAAAAGSGPGSNTNALALANIKDEKFLPGGADVDEYYSHFVFQIGLDAGIALDNLETRKSLLTQLQNQRDAVTSVDLDEEAINILRYQKAYQANARFIGILDDLTEELVNLLGA